MSPLSTLRQAYGIVSNERQWCSGALAKDANGIRIHYGSSKAVAWCTLGILQRLSGFGSDLYEACLMELGFSCPAGLDIVEVNDVLGHRDVCRMFERTIRKLEVRERVRRLGRAVSESTVAA